MPFALVQENFLADELCEIQATEIEASDCASDIEDMIRELSDENREKYIEEEDEKLKTKELAAAVKAMKKDPELREEELVALQGKLDQEKELKKRIKKLRDELEQKTHACIESLTDEDAYKLLGQKWIMPLCKKIFALPVELLDAIERDVTKLTKRYADTLLSVGTEIEKAEKELAAMLGELTGGEADMQAIQELSKMTGNLGIFVLLDKLFPKKGEKVPALRFKEFTEEWEDHVLEDVYYRCIEKNDLSFGPDKIISVANMFYRSEVSNSSDDYMKTYNIMRLGDIAYEGNKSINYAYGRWVENDIGDGIVSHVFEVLRPKCVYDLLYWKYAINNEYIMRKLLLRSTKKATMMTNVVVADFLKQKILIPTINEQNKIGKLLAKLDNLLSLREKQLTLLKHTKQALLEQMFVNE